MRCSSQTCSGTKYYTLVPSGHIIVSTIDRPTRAHLCIVHCFMDGSRIEMDRGVSVGWQAAWQAKLQAMRRSCVAFGMPGATDGARRRLWTKKRAKKTLKKANMYGKQCTCTTYIVLLRSSSSRASSSRWHHDK